MQKADSSCAPISTAGLGVDTPGLELAGNGGDLRNRIDVVKKDRIRFLSRRGCASRISRRIGSPA
jgi:hypothetical protein